MRKITKRSAAVVLPIAVLGVAGVAFAANLGVSSDLLGGGSSEVTSACPLKASYNPITDVTWLGPITPVTEVKDSNGKVTTPGVAGRSAGYYVKSVTIAAPSSCVGAAFRLTATGLDQNQLSEYRGTVTAASAAVALDAPVPAQQVTSLYAVVTQPVPSNSTSSSNSSNTISAN